MAKSIPIEWVLDGEEMALYTVAIANHNNCMTCGMNMGGEKSFGQMKVHQAPRYENQTRKRGRRPNQVIGKGGIIRPDKRHKIKYL